MRNMSEKKEYYKPWKYGKELLTLWLFLTIIMSVSAIVQIYAVSDFIDAACDLTLQKKWNSKIVFSVVMLFLTVGVQWIGPQVIRLVRRKTEVRFTQCYRPSILKKCASIKYEYVEDSQSWDVVSRVVDNTEIKWCDYFEAINGMVELLINVCGIILIIASQVWWAAIVILIFGTPIFYLAVKGGKSNYKAKRDASVYIRKYNYISDVLKNRDYVEERNLFGYSDRVNEKYRKNFKEAFWIETKTAAIWAIKTKLSGALSMFVALLIVITLLKPTIDGQMSPGMFISLVNAVFLLTAHMSWGLSQYIDKIVAGREFCKDVSMFYEFESDVDELETPKMSENVETIEFRNVTFKYPGSDKYVLNGMSFLLEKGKKYAFVGVNGAGKSTVVKLLLGLYSDYIGEILINGREMSEYTKAERKGFFATTFQDYLCHNTTIRENMTLSEVKDTATDEKIYELMKKFGINDIVNDMQDGLSTNLGKIKQDGIELSGGQWQKIAIIRTLLKNSSVRILDEPTASLDPKMESEVYSLFQELENSCMTILISHRLGFVKDADCIFLFDNGVVKEKGTFGDMMKINGSFALMYEEQKRWYE